MWVRSWKVVRWVEVEIWVVGGGRRGLRIWVCGRAVVVNIHDSWRSNGF